VKSDKMKQIYRFTRSDMLSSNCYVFVSNDECAVIDPSVPLDRIKRELIDLPKIKYILLTHSHLDHLWEISSYDGAKILASDVCCEELTDNRKNGAFLLAGPIDGYYGQVTPLSDGEQVFIGDECLTHIKTPGHSKSSSVFLGEGYAFTGDTLFAHGGYGRYDLAGGDLSELRLSLERLLSLDGDTVIYSGHGDVSTISETKQYFL
jgi:glyoxylase-like metal-dependent hydrolase (beta-lactamase superfamily II)